jgi:cell division protein FtsW (lipid II flippase)
VKKDMTIPEIIHSGYDEDGVFHAVSDTHEGEEQFGDMVRINQALRRFVWLIIAWHWITAWFRQEVEEWKRQWPWMLLCLTLIAMLAYEFCVESTK